jgi:branched-chain amino acid transport system permease protein
LPGLDDVADTTIVVLVFATLAVAWSWLGSYAGVVSFMHAVFFGIGGFAVAASNFRGGSPWYGALGGALFAVLIGVVCGLLCLRGRGYTFSFVTLAIGAPAEWFAAAHDWLGPHDVYAFPLHPGFLNLQFTQKWPYVLLALAVFAVAQALTFGLRSARIGFYLRALRANPAAAGSVGVRAFPPRLITLVASAFVTSVAGSLFAQWALAVSPHAFFALSLSFDIALIGVVAGPASVWGPPLAALVYVLIAKVVPLHPAGPAGMAVLALEGAAVVVIAFVRPDGIFAGEPPRSAITPSRSAA